MSNENVGKNSRENMIVNGSVVNRGAISSNKFAVNSKFLLSNGTYNGEFRVTESTMDSGTSYRRMIGNNEDVVVTLTYL